jgi:integrase
MPITKRDVDALQPDTVIWDEGRGSVAGFGARRQAGRPAFVLKARLEGKQKWITIGRYGAPWTVDSARDRAKVLLGQIAQGEDPQAATKRADADRMTVGDLCDRYLAAAKSGLVITRRKKPKAPSTLALDAGRIEAHIRPLIGSKTARQLKRADVQKMVDDITAGKTNADRRVGARARSIVRGGAVAAGRTADLLSAVFSWAQSRDLLAENPVRRIDRIIPPPRDRYLSDEEFRQLGRVLAAGRDEGGISFNPMAIEIVTILALTGCRMNEVAALSWAEVDFDTQCLRLAETKTGRNIRPIGKAAAERLRLQPRHARSPYLFPSVRSEGPYQGIKREASRIFRAANLADVTCHTLRHSFATKASELEFSDLTIAGLLGHKLQTVTSRYTHRPEASLIQAADKVSQSIDELLTSLSVQGRPPHHAIG